MCTSFIHIISSDVISTRRVYKRHSPNVIIYDDDDDDDVTRRRVRREITSISCVLAPVKNRLYTYAPVEHFQFAILLYDKIIYTYNAYE